MSAFVGIFFRKIGEPGLQEWSLKVRNALGAQSPKMIVELASACAFILKYDPGAYSQRGDIVRSSGNIGVLAGHPYVDGIEIADRNSHLDAIMRQLELGNSSYLAKARGTYSLAHVDMRSHSLTLATDCLGVRPVYFYEDAEKVLFSSTLEVFAKIPGLDLVPNERGTVERAVLGFYLCDRTRYRNVKCLLHGQCIVWDSAGKSAKQYWTWSTRINRSVSQQDSLREVFDGFIDATRIRLGDDKRVMAFLTGGLDSRCVVAALRLAGTNVNTLNFASENSADLVFGSQIAAALRTNHLALPMSGAWVAGKVASAIPKWIAAACAQGFVAERPNLVWSGDGGSVGLGHVYLTDSMVDLMESGRDEEAVKLLLNESGWIVPRGIVKRDRASLLAEYPLIGMLEAFRTFDCDDRGRALHILLMITDQRQHLFDHFERIYQHGCELQLPFFDRDFLLSVLKQPVRPFVAHRFYGHWLKMFQPELLQIPWQAYPGHDPCPVPVPKSLTYQWDVPLGSESARLRRRAAGRRTFAELLRGDYRNSAISKSRLGFVSATTLLGLRDYSYALDIASQMRVDQSDH